MTKNFKRSVFIFLSFAAFSSASLAETKEKEPSSEPLVIPTDKDASLIRESLCCGFVADKNFGDRETVDAGQYHHVSEALIGFSKAQFPLFSVVRKATLEVEARVVGSGPATVDIGFSNLDWDEKTVTYDDRPEALASSRFELNSGLNRMDVTEMVREAWAAQGSSFSFLIAVPASSQSNVFITSKEGSAERSAALILEFEDSPTL